MRVTYMRAPIYQRPSVASLFTLRKPVSLEFSKAIRIVDGQPLWFGVGLGAPGGIVAPLERNSRIRVRAFFVNENGQPEQRRCQRKSSLNG